MYHNLSHLLYLYDVFFLFSIDTHVAKVFAHDDDGTERNILTSYIIIKGGSDRFTIDARGGMVSVQLGDHLLDREKKDSYTLEIMAINDQGYPPQNSSTEMFIEVLDVNDSPPRFNQSEYEVSIKENTEISKPVFHCPVKDPDEDTKLEYKITGVVAFTETGKTLSNASVSCIFIRSIVFLFSDKVIL